MIDARPSRTHRLLGRVAFAILTVILIYGFRRLSLVAEYGWQIGILAFAAGLALCAIWILRSGSNGLGLAGFLKHWAGAQLIVFLIMYPASTNSIVARPIYALCLLLPVFIYLVYAIGHMRTPYTSGTTFKRSLLAIFLPDRMVSYVEFELEILWIAIAKWSAPKSSTDCRLFTSYGIMAPMLIAILVLSAVEIVVVHILVSQWSEGVALIVSGVGIFCAIYVFGILKSLITMPSIVGREMIVLRLGILQTARIPKDCLIEICKLSPSGGGFSKAPRIGGMSPPNLLLKLTTPVCLNGPFGSSKLTDTLALFVDRPSDLLDAISQAR